MQVLIKQRPDHPQPAHIQRRDWRRVAITWLLVLGSHLAYRFYPATVPIVLPGVVLLISRVFIRTEFPQLSGPVWLAFWLGQLFFLVSVALIRSFRIAGLIFGSLGSAAIFAWFVFIIVSDAFLLRRSLRADRP